jgi:hypothetical protein
VVKPKNTRTAKPAREKDSTKLVPMKTTLPCKYYGTKKFG